MAMEAISSLNNQAACRLAAGNYVDAMDALAMALEQLHSRVNLSPHYAKLTHPVQGGVEVALQNEETSHVSAVSNFYPLPTCFMVPAVESTLDLFRECFVLQTKPPSMTRPVGNSDADAILMATILYFNLGLCCHLRGLQRQSPLSPQVSLADIADAEIFYRFALDLVRQKTSKKTVQDKPKDSAYWLLVLAVINNLGSIALEAADHQTVQDCLGLGLSAMQSIDLPISWTTNFAWGNPAAAA